MDKIKKILLFRIPMSKCNFRCHYCYLAQRPAHYEGIQPKMLFTPQQVANALSIKRLGGVCYANFCADGETLLTKDIDLYVKALVEQGHYAEIVTNLTITPVLEKFLAWNKELLKRIEFKCSLHYLELKKKRLLNIFANNVHKIWQAGASANIELVPCDELIPYLNEVKAFCLEQFGALPHLTIARNDNTKEIEYLTSLSDEEYERIWSQFDSEFWNYKRKIFKVKQTGFCYAGAWSAYIDLPTGKATACYGCGNLGNVFEHPERTFPVKPIAKCPIAHCYNGHAHLTMGLIPHANDVRYGDIRNRKMGNGQEWLQQEVKDFFNSKLEESNHEYSAIRKCIFEMQNFNERTGNELLQGINKLCRILHLR